MNDTPEQMTLRTSMCEVRLSHLESLLGDVTYSSDEYNHMCIGYDDYHRLESTCEVADEEIATLKARVSQLTTDPLNSTLLQPRRESLSLICEFICKVYKDYAIGTYQKTQERRC